MTLVEYIVVAAGGVLAGALNVAAAGGAVLSFLTLTWAGLPPHAANSTNLVATPFSFLGMLSGAWRERRQHVRRWPLLLAAGSGTVLGVLAFRLVPVVEFRLVVPLLLAVSAATLIAHPLLKRRLSRRPGSPRVQGVVMTVGIFATSTYAGFYGGGVGVLVLLVLALTTAWPWLAANHVKNLIGLVTSIIGAGVMAVTGGVEWLLAAVLALGLAVGGLAGQWALSRLARSQSARDQAEGMLREIVAVSAAFGAGVMISSV